MNNTIPVRKGEELDYQVIYQYIKEHIPNIPNEEMEILQFPAGKSNLTYFIKIGEWEAVLRRPPSGPLPPKAHNMEREYSLLNRLGAVFDLVPRMYALCQDRNLIGVPFYLMEYKKGISIKNGDEIIERLNDENKAQISNLMVNTIIKLHDVDYTKAGLDTLGYPEGFLERQVKGWVGRYKKYETDQIENVDKVINWLLNNIPKSEGATLIHNDYKINNVIFSEDFREIKTIVDWEMATIGDPLFDLGAALSYWVEENDSELVKNSLDTITARSGFMSRNDYLNIYATKTGRDVSNFPYYLILNYFKIAVAQQQIYYRFKSGKSRDKRFLEYNTRVKNLLTHVYYLTEKSVI